MPKRADIQSVLIIGAGPIIIGQACEFDYSGTQACKALRSMGYEIVLVNSNPATIMTDPETADVTYVEPITWQVVEKIIEKELLNRLHMGVYGPNYGSKPICYMKKLQDKQTDNVKNKVYNMITN